MMSGSLILNTYGVCVPEIRESNNSPRAKIAFVFSLFFLLDITACGGGGSPNARAPVNSEPTISGVPVSSVLQDTQYSFVPTAIDADGDSLLFSIDNLPVWAAFDTRTGALTGSPGAAQLGTYDGVVIKVSDGQVDVNLPEFGIEVVAMASGSLTIAWTPPLINEDGSALTDLAEYRIRYGTQTGDYPNLLDVSNPGLSRYSIENLVPAEYFIVISAVDTSDNESANSNEARSVVE
jgi:hypothetical protein